jgi:hypothetical protein
MRMVTEQRRLGGLLSPKTSWWRLVMLRLSEEVELQSVYEI